MRQQILIIFVCILLFIAFSGFATAAKDDSNFHALALKGSKDCTDGCGNPPNGNDFAAQYQYQSCLVNCLPVFSTAYNYYEVDSFFDIIMNLQGQIDEIELTPGPEGPPGPPGADGEDGANGALGEKGDKGDKGDAGDQGPQGEPGLDGADGLPGAHGQDGTDGLPGIPGADGRDGVDGTNCWDLNGNSACDGHEDVDANGGCNAYDCQGDKGDQGIQGLPGADGAPGDKGDTGECDCPITIQMYTDLLSRLEALEGQCVSTGPEICDGDDNDCDGEIDEGPLWTNKGEICVVGAGVCQRMGNYICDVAFPDGPTICNSNPGVPTETPETTCNDGLDNDCDNDIDGADSDCVSGCPADYVYEGDNCIHQKQVDCIDVAPLHSSSNIVPVTIFYWAATGWEIPADCAWSCDSEWDDCNGDQGDGCEIHMWSDINHCGACQYACGTENVAIQQCTGGLCDPICQTGWGDCNSDGSDGCETDYTTVTNCGGCGIQCAPGDFCTEGVCTSPSVDEDGDGWCGTGTDCPFGGGDCDDANANIFPGNPEVCDDLDNNCDGPVDNGAFSDSSEPNGACSSATTLATVGSDQTRTYTDKTIFGLGDNDYYRIDAVESDGSCECCDAFCLDEDYQLEITLTVPSGAGSYMFCTGETCGSVGSNCQEVLAGQTRSWTWSMDGACVLNDEYDRYVRVYGDNSPAYDCEPYTLSYSFTPGCYGVS